MMSQLDYAGLLTREEWKFDELLINNSLAGMRVLITGAGGSIGSSVARRIANSSAAGLALVDHSENALFNVFSSVRNGPVLTTALVDNLGHPTRALCYKFRPNLIIHAAAFKHVGLMEAQPSAAFINNTHATMRMARWAWEIDSRFLFISTDKAVRPTTYMGASKRLAEAWLFTHARDNTTVCRFGNVLGSSGSLVEIAANRILSNAVVEITHPDMRRYFITPNEAVGLILTSLQFRAGPGPFSLNMGDPVPIVDLVKRLGFQLGRFVNLKFVQGAECEKLSEDLLNSSESRSATLHPGIWSLGANPVSTIDDLIRDVQSGDLDLKIAAQSIS